MKSNSFRNKIAGALFTLSLLLGIGFAGNVTTQAQYRNDQYQRDRDARDQRARDRDRDWGRERDGDRRNDRRGGRYNDGYGDYGGSFDLRQTALNAGANEGIKAGREDRRRGRSFEYRDQSAFQKATKDHSSRLGNRELYQRYFRAAFVNAYKDGYSGY